MMEVKYSQAKVKKKTISPSAEFLQSLLLIFIRPRKPFVLPRFMFMTVNGFQNSNLPKHLMASLVFALCVWKMEQINPYCNHVHVFGWLRIQSLFVYLVNNLPGMLVEHTEIIDCKSQQFEAERTVLQTFWVHYWKECGLLLLKIKK